MDRGGKSPRLEPYNSGGEPDGGLPAALPAAAAPGRRTVGKTIVRRPKGVSRVRSSVRHFAVLASA